MCSISLRFEIKQVRCLNEDGCDVGTRCRAALGPLHAGYCEAALALLDLCSDRSSSPLVPSYEMIRADSPLPLEDCSFDLPDYDISFLLVKTLKMPIYFQQLFSFVTRQHACFQNYLHSTSCSASSSLSSLSLRPSAPTASPFSISPHAL